MRKHRPERAYILSEFMHLKYGRDGADDLEDSPGVWVLIGSPQQLAQARLPSNV
jgi:hypothetical protein